MNPARICTARRGGEQLSACLGENSVGLDLRMEEFYARLMNFRLFGKGGILASNNLEALHPVEKRSSKGRPGRNWPHVFVRGINHISHIFSAASLPGPSNEKLSVRQTSSTTMTRKSSFSLSHLSLFMGLTAQ